MTTGKEGSMVIIEVECMCSDRCGNTFKISEGNMERTLAFNDVLISLACPNTDLNKESIIEQLEDFAIISKLEISS
jgi:hypothetical protein